MWPYSPESGIAACCVMFNLSSVTADMKKRKSLKVTRNSVDEATCKLLFVSEELGCLKRHSVKITSYIYSTSNFHPPVHS